jgi:hypothetical protein
MVQSKLLFLGIFFSSCITRAPSEYELDRRAGLIPSSGEQGEAQSALGSISVSEGDRALKEPSAPARQSSRLEKVLVFDQALDDQYWLQSTYVYLEIERGRWLGLQDEGAR